MCGRFVLARANADLVPLFGLTDLDPGLPGPSYNIAPSEAIALVTESAKDPAAGRRLVPARWGLVPAWYASPAAGPTPFNARIEKVATSGMYRGPFARRRGIVPADGFYERRRADRQSFFVTPKDGSPLALAALYDWWRDQDRPDDDAAAWLLTATIVTQPAQGSMIPVHDREPLYLTPDFYDEWLDPATAGGPALLAAAQAAATTVAGGLDFRPVGPGWLATTPGRKRDDPGLIAT